MPKAQAQAAAPSNVLPYRPASEVTPLNSPPAYQPTAVTSTNPVPSAPRTASTLPDSMSPDPGELDLLATLREERHLHSDRSRCEVVRLYQFPAYLSLNLRRVLARDRSQRSKSGPALACLIDHGVRRYLALPAVRAFSQALDILELDDDAPAASVEQIEGWKRGLRLSISDPTHALGLEKARSVRIAETVHAELFDLAGKLGLSGSTLGTVCVMAGLEGQKGVLAEHAAHMRETVGELDRMLLEREARLRTLVGLLRSGIWS